MFQYVNITHSDTDPGLDPADISTTPAQGFPIHPTNDSNPQPQVPYNVHPPLELPLVNSDANHQSNKIEPQPMHHPVNGIFPIPDSHGLPSHQRSIDHVVHQPQGSITHPALSPPHQDPHLAPHHDNDSHLPSQFPRNSDKPPHLLHSVTLPLPLPMPHRPPQPLTNSQPQSNQSHWGLHLPGAPHLQSSQPSNPMSRMRAQLPSDQVFYPPPNPVPNASSHVQPPAIVNGDTFRPLNVRSYRTNSSVHREIDQHQHRSPRKRQKRSLVWNFFKESESDPNVAFCLICKSSIPRGRNLARNTTNLRKHLEHRHPKHVTHQNLVQQAKRGQGPHMPVVPPPAPLMRHDVDDITAGARNRNAFVFPSNSQPHRGPGDDRMITMHPSQPPQIPISQDRSALSLLPGTVYHGATQDGRTEPQFRQSQSLDESSSLVPTSNKRCTTSSNPLQMSQIPISNLYNSQPQGSTQLPVQDLTESGPHARNKDTQIWDPKGIRQPSKRFFPEGDDGEEANSNGDRQPASQEASAALVKFLAAAGLPLSAACSRSLLGLLDSTNNRPYFPNATELREHILPNQVTLLHSKIRNALSSADVIVATIEKRDKNRLLICHYFAKNFRLRSVCLDVIHPAEVKDGYMFGRKAPSTETSAFLHSRKEQVMAENGKRIRKLLQRVSNNLDYWKITHKVNAVIVAEKGITADNSHFLPEPSSSGNLPSFAVRDAPDSSSKSSRRPPYGSEHGPGSIYDQASDIGASSQNRIPVLSCLISTIERIIAETICQNDIIERLFVEPLSRGIYKALTDREFLSSEASQAWGDKLKLPVRNPSPWELRSLLSFYNAHMETVQLAVKRVDPQDLTFLCMFKGDIMFLHSLLDTFALTVQKIDPQETNNRTKPERTSTALPVMKNLLQQLESLHEQVSDSLRAVITNVVRAVRFQASTMEKQNLYACATLLDPRFKSGYLSKSVLDDLKAGLTDACNAESRRMDGRSGKANDSMGNQIGNQSSALEHYMESIIPERTVSSSALSTYLSEPPAGFNEDIDDYWNRNQVRWPTLAKVAARYSIIPCSCGSERISEELGGAQCRIDRDIDLSGKEIQAMSAMEFLRMNTV